MNLRLKTLAQMVDPQTRLADIGTDHAYLPISLVQSGKINYAIASDIAAGPLANAEQDIQQAGLTKQIETRLGPGLTTITAADKIETVVIAGMGGKLMTQILNAAWKNKVSFATLILAPNVGEYGVRKWLNAHCYYITAEEIVAEAGHTYELIKAQQTAAVEKLSERQLFFGPHLLQAKNVVFYHKWQNQLHYEQQLLLNLNQAKHKDQAHLAKVAQEINLIKGELNDQS